GDFIVGTDHTVKAPGHTVFIGIFVAVYPKSATKAIIPLEAFDVNKRDGAVNFIQSQQFKNGKISVALKIQNAVYCLAFCKEMLVGNPISHPEPAANRP